MHISQKFIVSLFLFVSAEAGLLSLAHWQHNRADEKTIGAQNAIARLAHPPVTQLNTSNAGRRITVHGVWDHTRTHFLGHQVHNGTPMWRVLTPFILNTGQEVIIDRGIIPPLQERLNPNPAPYAPNSTAQTLETAIQMIPHQKGMFRGATQNGSLLLFPDFTKIPTANTPRLKNLYLQALKTTHAAITPAPIIPQGANQHRQYRNTWLACAAILFLLYSYALRINLRSKSRSKISK